MFCMKTCYEPTTFQINAGENLRVARLSEGNTIHLQTAQVENYPFADSLIIVGADGCPQTSSTTAGLLDDFTIQSGLMSIFEFCEDNIGSFDPNDKQGFPEGVGEDHILEANTSIKYKIRFQNTGTDTAFTVVIRDTISEHLDLSTIQILGASHPYEVGFTPYRELSFTFDDILLPDSTTNEPASHGFIQYQIRQNADLPLGTVIENRAGIYFDFNDPIITNTVFHTIGEIGGDFVSIANPSSSSVQLKVVPNPFRENAFIEIGQELDGAVFLEIFDIAGKRVSLVDISPEGGRLYFKMDGQAPGIYTFRISDNIGIRGYGKFVVR